MSVSDEYRYDRMNARLRVARHQVEAAQDAMVTQEWEEIASLLHFALAHLRQANRIAAELKRNERESEDLEQLDGICDRMEAGL